VNQSKEGIQAIREGYIPIIGAELFKMYCNYCSKYEKTCGLTLTTFGTNIKTDIKKYYKEDYFKEVSKKIIYFIKRKYLNQKDDNKSDRDNFTNESNEEVGGIDEYINGF